MMQEIELKFQVPEPSHERLVQKLKSLGARICRMQAAYFDSEDRDLGRAGVALRLRREDGQWVQTLKARGEGLVQRLEHNVARTDAGERTPVLELAAHEEHPAGRALQRLLVQRGLVAGDLTVQYETAFDRLAFHAVEPQGLRVEVALDLGEVRAWPGGALRCLPLRELEFELLEGALPRWLQWLRSWVQPYGLWLDLRSKAERGDRLARGLPPPVLEVRPQAALRLLLEGVLRHSAECIEGLGDARHHQALLRGLQALTGLAEIPPGKVDELSDLHHKLMGAAATEVPALLGSARTQSLLLDLLGLALDD
jgi:triphosphatase